MELQRLMGFVRKASDDYGMISPGDKIAVGLSGGKDSLSLLVALNALRRYYPHPYELCAVTVSLGFQMDFGPLRRFCDNLGVPLDIVETDIAEIVFNRRKEENPCSLCSKMRKGALNARAAELGCNKTALGHNLDDVIETFFMCLFYEGRVYTFAPVTYLDRTGITAIRPLIYVPEKEVKSFAAREALPVIKNACPADKNTKREEVKSFVKAQSHIYTGFQDKIFGAVQRSDIRGWEKKA